MTGAQLRELLATVTADLERHIEEFRSLDAAVGDGDLGITVEAAARAVRDTLAQEGDDLTVAGAMRASAQAIAKANPSTMSALLAAGLLQGAKEVGADPVEVDGAAAAGSAFLSAVATKGKAERGDKTMLDALGPAVDAVAAHAERGGDGAAAIAAAVEAAERGVAETTPLAARKGRARWVGERSQDHPDPGAVVALRFLEAWQRHH